jgi:hypothetical protein
MMANDIQSYDVFISYAHADSAQVAQFVTLLQSQGLVIWS